VFRLPEIWDFTYEFNLSKKLMFFSDELVVAGRKAKKQRGGGAHHVLEGGANSSGPGYKWQWRHKVTIYSVDVEDM